MNQIGIFVFWLFGVALALWFLYGILRGIFKLYVNLRDDMLFALRTESMILVYRKYKEEIDDYIRKHYPEEVKK